MRIQIAENAVIVQTAAAPTAQSCHAFMANRQSARKNTRKARSEAWGRMLATISTVNVDEAKVQAYKALGNHTHPIQSGVEFVSKRAMMLGYGRRAHMKSLFRDAEIALRGYVFLGRCRPEPADTVFKMPIRCQSFTRSLPSHGFIRGRRKAA